ncbi:uncharacterized protein DUF4383 [Paractinoplanes brasiliensis]|uniref:Uncharacterized protein DUF4383 n=2 Tax=Paractinoplanes brasiliensis TaxID=52695 RepID=A0A4R6JTY8_9ACTN|nr:uncharacterized protein DUF4383 [Actinoplanes brasiliensis]GID25216.1 hypothetical protein Abr02nite_01990 [Actinoplanes brasiliensis]
MAHTPVNHPLRPIYRALSFISGAYLVVFGVIGMIQTSGENFTGVVGVRVLGQETNMLWSIVALVVGIVVLAAAAMGRNLDVAAGKYLGWALLVVGSYELATNRTDANLFGFSMSTVVVTYLVGLILILASMYSKVAPQEQAGAPRQVREHRPA